MLVPVNESLTFEETGVLVTMLNNADCPNVDTIEALSNLSSDSIDTVKKIVRNLYKKRLLIYLNGGRYIVNKETVICKEVIQ